MNTKISFSRSHTVTINASAGDILDYVSNPNSWPEWLVASHKIISADKPLEKGETFQEEWHTRTGEAKLNWTVEERSHPNLWTARTKADFLGPIIVTYEIEEINESQCQFTRRMTNPDRPKPPSEDAIKRMDEEADIALSNIKRNVEAMGG